MADPIQTARIVEAMARAYEPYIWSQIDKYRSGGTAFGNPTPQPLLNRAEGWATKSLEQAQAALSTAYPMIREEMARIADAKLCVELRNATAAYNLACREIATAIRATELAKGEE